MALLVRCERSWDLSRWPEDGAGWLRSADGEPRWPYWRLWVSASCCLPQIDFSSQNSWFDIIWRALICNNRWRFKLGGCLFQICHPRGLWPRRIDDRSERLREKQGVGLSALGSISVWEEVMPRHLLGSHTWRANVSTTVWCEAHGRLLGRESFLLRRRKERYRLQAKNWETWKTASWRKWRWSNTQQSFPQVRHSQDS